MLGLNKTSLYSGAGATRSTALIRARASKGSIICDELVGAVGYTAQKNNQPVTSTALLKKANKKFEPIEKTLLSHELLTPSITLPMARLAKAFEVSLRRPADFLITRVQQEDGKKINFSEIKTLPPARALQMNALLQEQYIAPYEELHRAQKDDLACLVVDTTFIKENLFVPGDNMKIVDGSFVHQSRAGTNDEITHQLYYSTYDTQQKKGVVKTQKKMQNLLSSDDPIERAVGSTKEQSLSKPGLDITDELYVKEQDHRVAELVTEIKKKSKHSLFHAALLASYLKANALYLGVRKESAQKGLLRTSVHYPKHERITPEGHLVASALSGKLKNRSV